MKLFDKSNIQSKIILMWAATSALLYFSGSVGTGAEAVFAIPILMMGIALSIFSVVSTIALAFLPIIGIIALIKFLWE